MSKGTKFFICAWVGVFMANRVPDNKSRKPREVGTANFTAVPVDSALPFQTESNYRFNVLYARLVSAMTDTKIIDVDLIENILIEICHIFRLSKAVTRVYRNQQEEREGKGETLCCFDNGKEGNEIMSLRVVTSVMTTATIKAYMCPDETPLNEDEYKKVDLVMRTVLSFISRNRMKDVVYELAYFDDAGYPNLRNWNNYIEELVGEEKAAGKLAFRYNLRHFSLINQEFGRPIGDIVMKAHFEKLQSIIGESGFMVRLGGDNFVGICDSNKTKFVIDYLTEAEVNTPKGIGVNIYTSAGFFRIPKDRHVAVEEIMGCIIAAYRVAQNGGMDNIVFYDESFVENRDKTMKIQQQFSEAIEKNEFRPFYQPKVNVKTGRLVGAEALCRWFKSNRVVSPAEFIPILEKTSDICRLDLHMLECVCRDMKRWADEGKEPIRISINFSRKHIINTYLPETIAEIVDRYSVPHELIDVEFTESTSEVEFEDLKRMATRLRSMGFYLSIDDFGIGYSSLNLIKDIPWTTLKVDKSFLPDDPSDENSVISIMFKHVVSMTGQLGLECISEGVETKQHVSILKNNGCEIAQGYFFDKPLSVEEFESRIAKGKYSLPW